MKNLVILSLCSLLVACSTLTGIPLFRNAKLDTAFSKINVGDSEATALERVAEQFPNSYIPGSQSTTYSNGRSYTTQTQGQTITSYGGNRSKEVTKYFSNHTLHVTAYKGKNSIFSVSIGQNADKDSQQQAFIPSLFAASIIFWHKNISPAKTFILPYEYPPIAAAEENLF